MNYETCPKCLARNVGGFASPQHVRPCPEHDLSPDPETVLPGEMEVMEKVYEWAMREDSGGAPS